MVLVANAVQKVFAIFSILPFMGDQLPGHRFRRQDCGTQGRNPPFGLAVLSAPQSESKISSVLMIILRTYRATVPKDQQAMYLAEVFVSCRGHPAGWRIDIRKPPSQSP